MPRWRWVDGVLICATFLFWFRCLPLPHCLIPPPHLSIFMCMVLIPAFLHSPAIPILYPTLLFHFIMSIYHHHPDRFIHSYDFVFRSTLLRSQRKGTSDRRRRREEDDLVLQIGWRRHKQTLWVTRTTSVECRQNQRGRKEERKESQIIQRGLGQLRHHIRSTVWCGIP